MLKYYGNNPKKKNGNSLYWHLKFGTRLHGYNLCHTENMITMVTPLHGYWVLLNTLEKFEDCLPGRVDEDSPAFCQLGTVCSVTSISPRPHDHHCNKFQILRCWFLIFTFALVPYWCLPSRRLRSKRKSARSRVAATSASTAHSGSLWGWKIVWFLRLRGRFPYQQSSSSTELISIGFGFTIMHISARKAVYVSLIYASWTPPRFALHGATVCGGILSQSLVRCLHSHHITHASFVKTCPLVLLNNCINFLSKIHCSTSQFSCLRIHISVELAR